MTCILVAHLGTEVIIAADKRVTFITPDGTKTPIGDGEEKIVRTPAGVITGCGSVAMLDPIKGLVREQGFRSPDDVLELILNTRTAFSEQNAGNPRLLTDLAQTAWMFTYPTTINDKPITRFAYYHPSLNAERLNRLDAGRVMCFPSGFSQEQAQTVQAVLQAVVKNSLESGPADEVRASVVACMLGLMSEISASSDTVSRTCDIALVESFEVHLAMNVSVDDETLAFIPVPYIS